MAVIFRISILHLTKITSNGNQQRTKKIFFIDPCYLSTQIHHDLIFESMKTLETKTSTVFNLIFANDTILSCFFFFYLIIGLYFLIPAVITQIFIAAAELPILTGIPIKEPKAEIETHPVTEEAKISNCSV